MSSLSDEMVQQYMARIGFGARPAVTEENLFNLQLVHMQIIPYDNMDCHMKRSIIVDDMHSIFSKLITRRRGGYCYEHNQLFLHILLALGYDATLLHSRVLVDLKPGQSRPMTHVIILVKLGGKRYIADVGGNIAGSPLPLLIDTEELQHMQGEVHRMVKQAEDIYLHEHQLEDETWAPLYVFNTHFVAEAQDCVMMNWWSQTNPASRHPTNFVLSLYTDTGMKMVHNNFLSIRIGHKKPVKTVIETLEAFVRLLLEDFAVPPEEIVGLVVPGSNWPPINGLDWV